MRPMQSVRYLWLVILLFATLAQAADEEQIVMSEEALWAAAGETYGADQDKSVALQQYQLFLNR